MITFKKITINSKAGLVLINYSHAILDQEIQNNGGCLEAAGPDRERLLQPITWPIYLPCTTAQGQYHCASNIISNSHPFHSKWVDPPIPEIQQFQYFTMNIRGQGHGWGQSLKSQCKCKHPINSHPFRSMSTGPPIAEIQHFQNLTLKIQGQCYTRRPHSRYNTLSTHITFVRCRWALTFLSIAIKNLTWKIQGQGHGWGERWKSHHGSNILSTHIPFVPSQSAIPFLWYSIFRLWPWKSKVKVMGEANIESHNMGPTSYQLTSLSFHVNLPSHS